MINLDTKLTIKGHQMLKRVESDLSMNQFGRWITSAYTDTRDFHDLDTADQAALHIILDEMESVLKNAVVQYFYGE